MRTESYITKDNCKIIWLLKENSSHMKSNLKITMKKDGIAQKSCKMSTFN